MGGNRYAAARTDVTRRVSTFLFIIIFDGIDEYAVEVFLVGVLGKDVGEGATEDEARAVDEGDIVAKSLGGSHVVGGKDDGSALAFETEDLATEKIGIEGVEAAEGFIEDEKHGGVEHSDNKLDLLLHTFGELLNRAVPPRGDVEVVEPLTEAAFGSSLVKTFETGEVDGLFTDTHLLIESSFLWEIADIADIRGLDGAAVETDSAGIGKEDLVDDADEGSLAGAIGAKESEDGASTNAKADIIEGAI